jgi:cytidyltransferase-like protein
MRTQPLHLGHVNLVRNLLEWFDDVRIVVGNQPPSREDPFPLELRLRWWARVCVRYELGPLEFRVGAHGRPDDERIELYTGGLERPAIVTGNDEVVVFWRRHGFAALDVRSLPLEARVPGVGPFLLERRTGVGSVVRAGLFADASPAERDRARQLVPPSIWEDIA